VRTLHAVVAAAFFALSVAYGVGSLLLPMGTLERPGPGFFPLMVALAMAILSGLLGWRMIGQRKTQPVGEELLPSGRDLRRLTALGGSLVLFALLLKPLGYVIATTLLMGTVLRLLGMKRWGRISLSAVLTTAISYWLFAMMLQVPLPSSGLF